jgi:hypothetical protein
VKGYFIVKDGQLVPVSDETANKFSSSDGKVFLVSLDDEQPLNDRQRAALFAMVREFEENLPDKFKQVFWQKFHENHHAPIETKLIVDMLKSMYGISSIADGRCSKKELSDFVRWAQERLEEISSAALNYK